MADVGTNRMLRRVIALVRRAMAEYRRMSKDPDRGPDPSDIAGSRRRRPRSKKKDRASTRPGTPQTTGDPTAIERAGRIEIVYAPERDGEADPGEVVWAWVPYEDDPSQGKDRPVLIIGRIGRQLAGVPLSSRNHDGGNHEHEWIAVGSGAWDDRGRPSHAHASRLLRFDPDQIRREGAALDRGRFDAVVERVRELHPAGG